MPFEKYVFIKLFSNDMLEYKSKYLLNTKICNYLLAQNIVAREVQHFLNCDVTISE